MHYATETKVSPHLMRTNGRAWVLSDGKAGHLAITTGVAEAMGLDYRIIPVAPRGLRRIFAPWAPVNPAKRAGAETSPFRPPWPDFVFAAGRTTIPYLRSIHWNAPRETFTVAFQDPRTGPRTADLIWVPEHDRLRGANVITTPTAPHRFSREALMKLRQSIPPAMAGLPSPKLAVLLGGPSGAYNFTKQDVVRLTALLASAASTGATLLMTVSRRTPPDLKQALGEAIKNGPHMFWQGEGNNPYPYFLATADLFLATADSVNMAGEAAATGRPLYIFHPSGGKSKFGRFHETLQRLGISREAPEIFERFDSWSYEPLHAAEQVAGEILQRWRQRKFA